MLNSSPTLWSRAARGFVAAAGLLLSLLAPVALRAQAPQVQLAPPALLRQFDVTAGTLQHLTVPLAPTVPFTVNVVLQGNVRVLDLAPHDVRAPGFQLLVADQNGTHVVPTPPSVTCRGSVLGDPDSRVAATVVDGLLTAVIGLSGNGGTWGVQPARQVDPNQSPRLHVVYHSTDNRILPFTCGNQGTGPAAPPTSPIELNMLAQIACEADYPFFQLNGSNVTTTQNDITGVINAMDVIYRANVQIQYTISTIMVRSSPDSYTSTNSSTLLGQFGSLWNATQGAVQRDVAHLFTGRNIDGSVIGIAYVGTVCAVGNAYGLSQSRFSGNMTYRTGLTSHEVGHNWNASHCDGAGDCSIMCATLGGCTGVLTSFGVGERNQILTFKNSRTCLTPVVTTPVISSLSPQNVPAFLPPVVTVTGTGFSGVTQVRVGTTNLANGQFTVLSDTQLRFTPPSPLSIGFAQVTITNTSGTSNPGILVFAATTPPDLAVPAAGIGGQPLTWSCGGIPNHLWFLMVSVNNQTSPFHGWPLLQGSSVLYLGGLNAAGLGAYTLTIPPAVLNGLTVYAQMLDIDGNALTLTGSTAVRNTRVWF